MANYTEGTKFGARCNPASLMCRTTVPQLPAGLIPILKTGLLSKFS